MVGATEEGGAALVSPTGSAIAGTVVLGEELFETDTRSGEADVVKAIT